MARKKKRRPKKQDSPGSTPSGDRPSGDDGSPPPEAPGLPIEDRNAEREPVAEASPPPADLDEDEPVSIDLDADLDDDGDIGGDAIARLIAETTRSAVVEAPVEEELVPIDLDDEPVPVELDGDESNGRVPTGAPSPTDSPPTERAREPEPTPIERGPISSPELRDRLLAATLAHAEHKDARYRVPYSDVRTTNHWKAALIAFLLLVAGVLGLAPPAWVRPDPPASLTVAERTRSLRLALHLQSQQVEAYRVRHQRLPATMEEMPAQLPGLRYVRSGTRAYQLVAYQLDGSAVVFDSSAPDDAFRSLTPPWAPSGVRP